MDEIDPSNTNDHKTKPFVPRSYQLRILEYAVKQNAIIYLPTGSGKTFIAFLAIKRFAHELQEPISKGGKRAIMMCNTKELSKQQAKALKEFCNLKVGLYTSERNVDDWTRKQWESELFDNQVLVGTCQIFVDLINHNYIRLSDLSIVIIDECHHASRGHPMSQFLGFLKEINPSSHIPRIIGLTGVLLKGKIGNIEKDLKSLEAAFRGNIVTVADMDEYQNVMVYSTKPKEELVSFLDVIHPFEMYHIIEKYIEQCYTTIDKWDIGTIPMKRTRGLAQIREPSKKTFMKNLLSDFLYQMKGFGLYAASIAIISVIVELDLKKRFAETIALKNLYRCVITQCERIRHILVNKLKDLFDDDDNKNIIDIILNYSSEKMRSFLIYLTKKLKNKNQKDISCIVFVERRYTAKCVYEVVKNFIEALPELCNVLKVDFMVGCKSISRNIETIMETNRKTNVMENFRKNICNVIICSDVLAEGIDIPACNYVIMLDPVKTFNQYIQIKGRARSSNSTFALFTPKSEQAKVSEQIMSYVKTHEMIKNFLSKRVLEDLEEPTETKSEEFVDQIKPFVVPSGARLTAESALSLIHRYCMTLPSDSFGVAFPWFEKIPLKNSSKVCVSIKLPLQSPVRETIVSDPMSTTKCAKISAAFKACKQLYEIGHLNSRLLPTTKNECVSQITDTLFPHWKKHTEDKGKKQIGSHHNKRVYDSVYPDEIYNAMPLVGEICYAYEIKVFPCFEPNPTDEHLVQLMKTSSNYALLLRKRLPPLAEMPLFMNQGMIKVKIVKDPIKLCISSEQDLEKLKRFHIMIFRDILQIWKSFFTVDKRNCQNTYLITPLRNGNIDWKLVNDFPKLPPLRKLTEAERIKKQYKPEEFLGKIVNTWYSLNEDDRYVVTKILTHMNPLSSFPKDGYSNYADFVAQKYEATVVHNNQFLIEVKPFTERRNFFNNAKNKLAKSKIKREVANIVLIPEMCHNFMYPGDLWLKALFLPSILYRLHYMLHAENIRVRVNNFLGIKVSYVDPKPLQIDASLKRVIDTDGNIIDEPEEPQKLLPALPTIERENQHLDIQSLSENQNWSVYLEPNDLERNVNRIYPIEVDYYFKFISGLVGDLGKLNLDDIDDYNECQLNMPKPKTVISSPGQRCIENISLEKRRSIDVLNRESSGQISSAEQCEFLAAITTAKAGDVFDMERLEVLGDSFLKFSISLYLIKKFPKWHEGYLTEVKSKFVSNRNLLYCMLEHDIPGRICASSFKPRSEWMPPLISIPNNIHELLKSESLKLIHISPSALYELEINEDDVWKGECSPGQLKEFVKNCRNGCVVDENQLIQDCVTSFVDKVTIPDKSVADTVESILGVCVKNYGIRMSFRMLKFFGLCNDLDNEALTSLLDLKLDTALLCANITKKEVDGFLINHAKLEENLGYRFQNRAYLLQALTHPSYPTNRLTGCYQELEFIGDAILDFLVSCYIFERCESMNPGKLTDLRSALVNNVTLACVCVRHRFHLFLLAENALLSESIKHFVDFQKMQDYRVTNQVQILSEEDSYSDGEKTFNIAQQINVPKALGDIVEALIAAVYLDSKDLTVTWNVIYHLMEQEINQFMCDVPINSVRQLYEYKGADPKFSDPVTKDDSILVECSFTCRNERYTVNGFGSNKDNAKKAAANHALLILNKY